MKVLIVNCGSSSLKYQLIDSASKALLAKGIAERIGLDGRLVYQKTGCDKEITDLPMPTHTEAVRFVLEALTNDKTGAIKDLSEIEAIGHRAVHGGEKFAHSVIIDDEVINQIKECSELAPLHNPANLIGMKVCHEIMPNVPMVAVFDTAFHQTMPQKAYMYGLPYEYYEKYKIRRYGFHGTSHKFVSKEAADFLGLDINNSKLIICHLGGGASISAVLNGECVDTSMGLTPLEGLVMGTRSGSIDPAIIEYIGKKENLEVSEVMNILNKKSGVFGLSKELSSDFRDLWDRYDEGNEYAKVALDVFCYSVIKYVGAYVAVMNGCDAVIFTAGIGENDHGVRLAVGEHLAYLGVKIDPEKNFVRGGKHIVSTDDSKIPVCVIATNEELEICMETVALVGKK